MTYFDLSNKPLLNTYGYKSQTHDLDCNVDQWGAWDIKGWARPFELQLVSSEQSHSGMTPADALRFTKISRKGFQYIAKKHCLSPIQMWLKVSDGLVIMGMHQDDLEDVQELLFGWKDLDADMLERYRWRYPDRCPLLDVLCTMDDSSDELNGLQDWILELKGSKDRRRLDLFPALPDPDGVRPAPKQIQEIKANSWGVASTINR
jgi:hypothetical protein